MASTSAQNVTRTFTEVKTDEFVSDKEIALELGPEYMSPCS